MTNESTYIACGGEAHHMQGQIQKTLFGGFDKCVRSACKFWLAVST